MTTQHTPYLLKVLSGSNAGALVRLKVGDLVIGRSMASDIILHDEGIADLHVKLKVSEDAISLETLAQPIAIDNQPVNDAEILLKPYEIVKIGSIEFFIADVRKPGGRGVEAGGMSDKSSEKSSTAHALREKVGERSFSRQQDKKASGYGKGWFWLGLVLLLLANFLFFRPFIGDFAERFGLKESTEQRAENLLDALTAEGLTVTKDPQGRVSIIGYVDTREERQALIDRILRADSNINHRIWVKSELSSNAERVAKALGQSNLRFQNLNEGRLMATGYVISEVDWARVKTNIMRDVSGIQSIADQNIQTLISRRDALIQFIDKKGLSSRVKVTIDRDRIKVDGELTQSELEAWPAMYQEFISIHGEGPAIIESLYDARKRIKLAIRSVSVGETPFLVSKDGKKYMEGASLGDDYFIKKITPDYVLLSNNGIEIPIHYGAESN